MDPDLLLATRPVLIADLDRICVSDLPASTGEGASKDVIFAYKSENCSGLGQLFSPERVPDAHTKNFDEVISSTIPVRVSNSPFRVYLLFHSITYY